ncbi:thioredoxin-like protein [Staphylococcus phage vB_SauM-HM01]|uniref:Thioredoxin-like protein n=5 Tax=Silviavirus remus TaxID=1857890 RepID=S4T8V0_9CAUD|nr:thioredoxin-like protein [Staphylococcus phage vB_SauM_Romulus]YP_008431196.1 thioredoxin-like protein [Staphylococcus phage vB_SauM_Remus]QVD57602.1 thioredoxin-like protein [Staphylococcus phage PM56]QVD58495.1 thioredoxin-like protein [Staphylococcus phage PM93]QVD58698.1 thioredoxin-like protein [Silviavirus remus]QVD58889.1 thioredoxin-like protein [Staphylococcus phage Romulus]QXV86163.1 thioredoxin-like protein [Staphylococcus phage SAPYZU_15]UGL60760.1 thioredoxin-like protein [St
MEKVNSLLELNTTIRQKKDVIVMVTQDECAKCEILKSVIPLFEAEGDITKPVYVINLDDKDVDREKAVKLFDIMSTPVLIGYKDGELAKKFEDQVTPKNLMELDLL